MNAEQSSSSRDKQILKFLRTSMKTSPEETMKLQKDRSFSFKKNSFKRLLKKKSKHLSTSQLESEKLALSYSNIASSTPVFGSTKRTFSDSHLNETPGNFQPGSLYIERERSDESGIFSPTSSVLLESGSPPEQFKSNVSYLPHHQISNYVSPPEGFKALKQEQSSDGLFGCLKIPTIELTAPKDKSYVKNTEVSLFWILYNKIYI